MLAESQTQLTLPEDFEGAIKAKIEKNGAGGRPSLLSKMAKEKRDVQNEVLNILEMAWLKNMPFGRIGRKYGTSYYTIRRLVQDFEPFKDEVVLFLKVVPRRKQWYNPETDSSDYDTVQAYIRRAKRDEVRSYVMNIKNAKRCWKALKYKDPANWTPDEVVEFLTTLPTGSQPSVLDGIRQVAPHLKELVKTGRFREKLRRRKKDVFGPEVNMIIEAVKAKGLDWHEKVFKLHVTTGAREGAKRQESGLTGISWDRFKDNFTKVDLYETKVRGGIWSRNCPVDIFFRDLPAQLREEWVLRGKPTDAKLVDYKELLKTYKEIRQAVGEYYVGRIEPSLLKELTTIRPHDADKIHVNLLWEAKVPLEVVAGQFIGRGEALGLVGRIWLSTDTIKKHYLSLTQRSERYKEMLGQIRDYAKRFNGEAHDN